MREDFNMLRDIGYEVIKEEGLPHPKDIYFRVSLNGTMKRRATCQKKAGTYRIIIHTVSAKFVSDLNGRYKDNKTGECFRRVAGEDVSVSKLVGHMAHEIAHLKFWKHNLEHHSYTNYLLSKIKAKANETGLAM